MLPFPATLHGVPVRVFHFTEDRFACIARADGRIDYVPATSLVVVSVQDELARARASLAEWRRLYGGAKKRESTWSGADADLCRRLTAENKALRDKQDAAALAMWRAETQAQTVAADHERKVRECMEEITRLRAEIAELRGER